MSPPGAGTTLDPVTARYASTRPAPKEVSTPGVPRSTAVERSRSVTWSGVRFGSLLRTSAATPATNGDACDVPLNTPYETVPPCPER